MLRVECRGSTMQVLLISEYWRAASTTRMISVMLLRKMSGLLLVNHLRHTHVRPGVESIRVLHSGDDTVLQTAN